MQYACITMRCVCKHKHCLKCWTVLQRHEIQYFFIDICISFLYTMNLKNTWLVFWSDLSSSTWQYLLWWQLQSVILQHLKACNNNFIFQLCLKNWNKMTDWGLPRGAGWQWQYSALTLKVFPADMQKVCQLWKGLHKSKYVKWI